MMVSHSGERHRSVKRHPFAWKNPIEKIVQFFADQETQAGSQISHLKKKKKINYNYNYFYFLEDTVQFRFSDIFGLRKNFH